MSALTMNVAQLRDAVRRLLDATEARFGSDVEFEVDYYWNVPLDAAFNLNVDPVLDMGQVSDDIDSVVDFAGTAADEPVSLWHECEHVAGVLRAIAQTASNLGQ